MVNPWLLLNISCASFFFFFWLNLICFLQLNQYPCCLYVFVCVCMCSNQRYNIAHHGIRWVNFFICLPRSGDFPACNTVLIQFTLIISPYINLIQFLNNSDRFNAPIMLMVWLLLQPFFRKMHFPQHELYHMLDTWLVPLL